VYGHLPPPLSLLGVVPVAGDQRGDQVRRASCQRLADRSARRSGASQAIRCQPGDQVRRTSYQLNLPQTHAASLPARPREAPGSPSVNGSRYAPDAIDATYGRTIGVGRATCRANLLICNDAQNYIPPVMRLMTLYGHVMRHADTRYRPPAPRGLTGGRLLMQLHTDRHTPKKF